MTLEASVLRDDGVRATTTGYEVDVHLPWYRSLPLSCVEDVQIALDGRVVDRAVLAVRHHGRDLRLDDLRDLVDEQWFVQDALPVVVAADAPRRAGESLDVTVSLAVRIPYILIGPQAALVQRTQIERKVTLR